MITALTDFYKINNTYNNYTKAKQRSTTVSFGNVVKYPSFSYLKPLLNGDFDRLDELKEIDKLIKVNGKFSLDKAAELIKNEIETQQMLYSEKDIENVIVDITTKNPKITKEEALNALNSLSGFSNIESISKIEDFCKKNKIGYVYRMNGSLSANSLFSYFSNNSKGLLSLYYKGEPNDRKSAVFVDREMVNFLKENKTADTILMANLKENIKKENIKLIVLDGWEAKTPDGMKSFNFAGAWDDLASTAASVAKAQKSGKNPFVDDIVKDLKSIFGKNIKINVIKNECENPNEKNIAERLNPKTISEKEIKKFLTAVSKYSYEILKNKISNQKRQEKERAVTRMLLQNALNVNKEKTENEIRNIVKQKVINSMEKPNGEENENDLSEIQSAFTKVLYPVIDVYSPRRLAQDMKRLHKKISQKLAEMKKDIKDVIFVVPNTQKSYGLVTYQYIKTNNIKNPTIKYPNFINPELPKSLTKDKVFVFLDDYSGSGQSFMHKDLPYEKFKKRNFEVPVIFAAVTHTDKAKIRVEKEISQMNTLTKRNPHDSFIGVHRVEDMLSYLKLLHPKQRKAVEYANKCGYEEIMSAIMFPHVIPDNCSDIAGFLLKNLLKSDLANKATMEFNKECRLLSFCKD